MYAQWIARLASTASDHLDIQQRINACARLVREGEIGMARPLLAALREHPAVGAEARRLLAACGQMERWGIVGKLERHHRGAAAATTPWLEELDFDEEVSALVARKPAAAAVLFVFTGNARMVWVSLHVLHQLIETLDCHAVYFRDHSKLGYINGVAGLGSDYDSAAAAMTALASELGAERIYCLGSSNGGYAALRYGFDIGAEAVLVYSALTDWSHVADVVAGTEYAGRSGFTPRVSTDLATLYGRPEAPHATLVFGEAHPHDAAAARRLEGLPKVTLRPIPGYERHDSQAQAIADGSFLTLLQELLATRRADAV